MKVQNLRKMIILPSKNYVCLVLLTFPQCSELPCVAWDTRARHPETSYVWSVAHNAWPGAPLCTRLSNFISSVTSIPGDEWSHCALVAHDWCLQWSVIRWCITRCMGNIISWHQGSEIFCNGEQPSSNASMLHHSCSPLPPPLFHAPTVVAL